MKTEGAVFKPLNREDYLESGYNQQNNQSPTAQQNTYLNEEVYMKNFEGSQTQGQGATVEESIMTRQQIQGHKDNIKQLIVNKNSLKVNENDQKVQKLNQYEIQHLSIKREGVNLMSIHNNHFEQMIYQNQINLGEQELKNQLMYDQKIQQPQLEDICHNNELGKMKEHNFEISNKYLHFRQEVIGQSVCGLNLYQLTITKRSDVSMKHKKKSALYIQSRLHAAETTGSLIMSYIMQEMSQNPEKYDKILNNYVIKLSPMLNPDGVVIGNSRSSLAGLDLNRRWSDPNPIMHPEIYFMKNHMILTEKQCKGISVFCDLHGHNKKMNCFIYGCNKAPNEGILSWTKTRLLPKIIASVEPIFDFNDCLFSQEKMKYNTARVVVWNEFKVMNSFTLETSMFGYFIKDSHFIPGTLNKLDASKLRQVCKQFTLEDFKSIGTSLLKSFVQYVDMEIELEKEFKATGGWLKKQKLDELAGETARKKHEINIVLTQQLLREKRKVPILRKSQISIHNPTIQQQVSKIYRSTKYLFLKIKPIETVIKKIPDNQIIKNNLQKIEPSSATIIQSEKVNFQQFSASKRQATQKDLQKLNKKIKILQTIQNNKEKQNNENLNSQQSIQDFDQIKNENLEDSENQSPTNQSNKLQIDQQSPTQEPQLNEWKHFFDQNELEAAIIESKKPIKKQEVKKQDIIESDSEPSCDNFDEQELVKRFELALSDDEIPPTFVKEEKKVEQIKQPTIIMPVLDQQKIQKIQDEIEDAKKKNKKLSQRFNMLRDQINAKIVSDQLFQMQQIAKIQIADIQYQNTIQKPAQNLFSDYMKQQTRLHSSVQQNNIFLQKDEKINQNNNLQGIFNQQMTSQSRNKQRRIQNQYNEKRGSKQHLINKNITNNLNLRISLEAQNENQQFTHNSQVKIRGSDFVELNLKKKMESDQPLTTKNNIQPFFSKDGKQLPQTIFNQFQSGYKKQLDIQNQINSSLSVNFENQNIRDPMNNNQSQLNSEQYFDVNYQISEYNKSKKKLQELLKKHNHGDSLINLKQMSKEEKSQIEYQYHTLQQATMFPKISNFKNKFLDNELDSQQNSEERNIFESLLSPKDNLHIISDLYLSNKKKYLQMTPLQSDENFQQQVIQINKKAFNNDVMKHKMQSSVDKQKIPDSIAQLLKEQQIQSTQQQQRIKYNNDKMRSTQNEMELENTKTANALLMMSVEAQRISALYKQSHISGQDDLMFNLNTINQYKSNPMKIEQQDSFKNNSSILNLNSQPIISQKDKNYILPHIQSQIKQHQNYTNSEKRYVSGSKIKEFVSDHQQLSNLKNKQNFNSQFSKSNEIQSFLKRNESSVLD